MRSLADRQARLESDVPAIRAAIRRHDPACWGEHLELFADPAALAEYRLRPTLNALARYAAERDALECLQRLRETDFPLHEIRGAAYRTLLHDAARRGAARVLAWLIDEQILDVNTCAGSNLMALHYAAQGGHVGVLQQLLVRHAFIDAATRHGETALHQAIYGRHADAVEVLIHAGANHCATTASGDTPLAAAARYGLRGTSDFLLERGAVTPAALPALLRFYGARILLHPQLKTVSLAVADPDVAHLFEQVDPADARRLLDRGADPRSAAIYALRNRDHDLLALIRARNAFGYGHAHYRSAAQCLRGMRQILAHGGDPNAVVKHEYRPEHRPLLFYVATNGDTDLATIPLLLDHGADPMPPRERGARPLVVELAAHRSDGVRTIRELVARGHDINARDPNGLTALHVWLVGRWDSPTVPLLREFLRLGADANACDAAGMTPLIYAASSSDAVQALRWTQLLLEAGADAGAADAKGRTVLHHLFAADTGSPPDRLPLLRCLLGSGADTRALDHDGRLPEDVECPRPDAALQAYLRRLRKREALEEPPPATAPAVGRRRPGL